ncbi:MAG: hypothetical protein ACP5VE_13930 [Chthonomonadales bacterium]
MDHMVAVAAVPIIIWVGVFLFMLMVDRKLAALEALHQEKDDL